MFYPNRRSHQEALRRSTRSGRPLSARRRPQRTAASTSAAGTPAGPAPRGRNPAGGPHGAARGRAPAWGRQGALVVRAPELSWAVPPTTVDRRLETTTAPTITSAATTAIDTRIVVLAPCPTERLTTAGAMSSATRFITLISGLMAGPAVSLNGSPTVSPMTVAACDSLPFPP